MSEEKKDFPRTNTAFTALNVRVIDAPRFFDANDKNLMSVTFLKNPDAKVKDKEGNCKYVHARCTVVVDITKTPWKSKLQKGDYVSVTAPTFEVRLYPSKSDQAEFGCGVEFEVRYPSEFVIHADLRSREDNTDDQEEEQPRTRRTQRTQNTRTRRQPEPEPADDVTDDDLPEGLDD